jgi:hypothetical protein
VYTSQVTTTARLLLLLLLLLFLSYLGSAFTRSAGVRIGEHRGVSIVILVMIMHMAGLKRTC